MVTRPCVQPSTSSAGTLSAMAHARAALVRDALSHSVGLGTAQCVRLLRWRVRSLKRASGAGQMSAGGASANTC